MTDEGRVAQAARQARNYRLVQIDSIFVGLITVSGTFLPVFLVRLGATGTQVGLLTSLPALLAFAVAIPAGRWLQGRRNIVPWYSGLRLVAWSGYAVMALVVWMLSPKLAVPAVLAVWVLASLPSIGGLVAFPVVMDGAAGPHGRFDLLGRRWAIAGVATSVGVVAVGQALGLLPFPVNFEWLLVGFSLAGVGSMLVSRRIRIPDQVPALAVPAESVAVRLRAFGGLIRGHPGFLEFELRSFVYTAGVGLAMPLLPLLYVNEVHAPDAWIGIIGAAQSVGAVCGYLAARQISRRGGAMTVLLPSLLVAGVVPAAVSLVSALPALALLALVSGVATAGAQLALFNELMKRVPRDLGVTFSAVDQSLQNFALILAPSLGGVLAVTVGVRPGLVVAAVVALAGLTLFAWDRRRERRGAV